MQAKTVSDKDLAVFLANRGHTRTTVSAAGRFLGRFAAKRLEQALRDPNGKPITLAWYVKKLHELFADPAATVAERMKILDRLKDLLLLGAIQEPELAQQIALGQAGPKPSEAEALSDPFADKAPSKLKIKQA